ncbi:MAG: MFS transporter [Planctomycetota bacterium]|jgi:nucleoside transporter
MEWDLYIRLSIMMFLEFAVWGAWAPVLASHLVGPLKMTGKQTGWIYATLWLGCIVALFTGGQVADRWLAAERFLAIVHLAGGVVLLVAARQRGFWPLLGLMGMYALLYAPTLGLTNSIMFTHEASRKIQAWIRVWGTIGWIVAGVGLALWRRSGKFKIRASDALTMGGILSLMMGLYCFFLPHTPPSKQPTNPLAFVAAFKMLQDPTFLVFIVISFLVTTELQFYYVPTAPFLEDIGVERQNVSAVMTLAQVAEIGGMVVLLPLLLPRIGFRWTLVIGVIFAMMRPLWLVISSLTLHGVGYTFFFFAGQQYVDEVAPSDIKGSAQTLILMVTLGLGNFIGTQITGVVMDYFKKEGKFQWRPIFIFPCVLTIACALAFILFFKAKL